MPDSGGVVDVISVVQRRRRWTPEQKLAVVREMERPGGPTQAALAGRLGLSRSLLFEWRRQVREGTMPGVARVEGAAQGLVSVRVVDDAPVTATCAPPPSRPAAPRVKPEPAAARTIEVVLANGRVLRVAEAIRPEVLGRIAAALDGA